MKATTNYEKISLTTCGEAHRPHYAEGSFCRVEWQFDRKENVASVVVEVDRKRYQLLRFSEPRTVTGLYPAYLRIPKSHRISIVDRQMVLNPRCSL